jgi:16S rRNA G966 N2-methylase RsmD
MICRQIKRMITIYIDKYYERKLFIKSDGYIVLNNKYGYSNYEPTSYIMLKKLFSKYNFDKHDHLIDFGCGLGRVLIFSSYMNCSKVTGIEVNEQMYNMALKNIKNYKNSSIINIIKIAAENFIIPEDANKFFFFNPFYLRYFIKVTNNILKCLRQNYRDIYIFLYAPSEHYINYLKTNKFFKLVDIIHAKKICLGSSNIYVYTINKTTL